MGITLIKEVNIDNCWADSEQPEIFDNNISLSEVVSWQEEQVFTKEDSENIIKKATRSVKPSVKPSKT